MNTSANHLAISPKLRTPDHEQITRNRIEQGLQFEQSSRELLAVMLTSDSASVPFQIAMNEVNRRYRPAIEARKREVEAHDSWLRAVYGYLFAPLSAGES